MADDSQKITINLKEKGYKIDKASDFKLLNNRILSHLEEIYGKYLIEVKNLYKIYYLDEDGNKIFIKKRSFKYFINISSKLYLEVNENIINQLKSEKKYFLNFQKNQIQIKIIIMIMS